ncbi:M50 family metallopeptidase [Bacillus sp. X1(2014)]|uniref:M50 family metallopeptidase n=1 Tax=Bacillus sp. X1(2014) TaxID=1565991 RepID=UPI00119ED17B|nr:M50 family metallopeptidase [Bacillus sp. X1(2014)]
MDPTTLILIYLVAGLVGSRLPFVRVYLAHCHNLVSMVINVCLEGGWNNKIHLHPDGTGQTTGSLISPFKKALISYTGYTVASAAAIGLFYFVSGGHYHLVVYLFLVLSVLALLLWIRNMFCVIWGLSLVALLAFPLFLQHEMIFVHLSIFLAAILFTQSIICAIHVCKQAFMSRSNPARKAALVQTKFIPAVILGLALFGQTLYAGYFFVQNFIGLPF